ncbi:MAG: glutamate formimidoyltransferase [Bacteroidales bacterium]|nr:glutamate formimidoyltransferase [Bacteroidales bacterium]
MAEKRLLECVPNFSEGKDMDTINQITSQIEAIEGVDLLDVDPGQATNRTVVTFVGTPDEVLEAAFQAVKKASQLIDMSKHSGAHPRFGATDVCPLVPVSGITMDEAVEYARKLAKRIGEDLQIPIYCYEHAAYEEKRRNLANCRSGEYEGLKDKLADPQWKPDFGPAEFNAKAGATAVGARDFLVAYNINLNTTSTRRANAIAFDIREKGRVKREGGKLTGKPVLDEQGNKVWIPGALKKVKGIGWYIEEYGIAQISLNLTDISVTPVHVAFDEACKRAEARGIRVTGSELVGLIPLKGMLEAGKYFLRKQNRSTGIPEKEVIKIAVKSLGLDDLYEFQPEEKIIEYKMAKMRGEEKKLNDLTVSEFSDETASESPAPGGGSVSAYMGSLGAALATMVANLSSHKRGWDDHWKEFSDWADKGIVLQAELKQLVDEDTDAFNKIMEAFKLPKTNDQEKRKRRQAIQDATKNAIMVPYRIMERSFEAFEVIEAMVEKGNPNSVTDAGVGALAVRSAIKGAYMNVRINATDMDDQQFVDDIIQKGRQIVQMAEEKEREILEKVENKM